MPRLLVPLAKAAGFPAEEDGDVDDREEEFLQRIVVRSGKGMEFVSTDSIDWIEAQDYYVRLHVGERSHLLRETLSRLESRLDPADPPAPLPRCARTGCAASGPCDGPGARRVAGRDTPEPER